MLLVDRCCTLTVHHARELWQQISSLLMLSSHTQEQAPGTPQHPWYQEQKRVGSVGGCYTHKKYYEQDVDVLHSE